MSEDNTDVKTEVTEEIGEETEEAGGDGKGVDGNDTGEPVKEEAMEETEVEEGAGDNGADADGGGDDDDDADESLDKSNLEESNLQLASCIDSSLIGDYGLILEEIQKVLGIEFKIEDVKVYPTEYHGGRSNSHSAKEPTIEKVVKVPMDDQLKKIYTEIDEHRKIRSHAAVCRDNFRIEDEPHKLFTFLAQPEEAAARRIRFDQGLTHPTTKRRLLKEQAINNRYSHLCNNERSDREVLKLINFQGLMQRYIEKLMTEPESAEGLAEGALQRAFAMLRLTNEIAFETLSRASVSSTRERRKLLLSQVNAPVGAKLQLINMPRKSSYLFSDAFMTVMKAHNADKMTRGGGMAPRGGGMMKMRGQRFQPYPMGGPMRGGGMRGGFGPRGGPIRPLIGPGGRGGFHPRGGPGPRPPMFRGPSRPPRGRGGFRGRGRGGF